MPRQPIYAHATRSGLRTRAAEPLARRARARRRALFLELMRPALDEEIVDVGCGATGLATLGVPGRITGVDRVERPGYAGAAFVLGDARALPLGDGAYGIAYSSSVLEHVPRDDQPRAAAELARVGRRLFVQTPNRWFPIEPHSLLPLVHWLPRALGRRLWALGVTGDAYDSISALSARDLRRLFPGCEVHRERVGPLTKSLIAVVR